jgi:hypothetical protein
LLAFRTWLLGMPGLVASDIVHLRGAQEEIWQKLLQLHFAPDPIQVLDWMLQQGAAATLAAYGGSAEQGMAAARGGAVTLSRWTQGLRQAVQAHPGHDALYSSLRRAAYTGLPEARDGVDPGLLLVSAGIDTTRPLGRQGDSFWWGAAGFSRIGAPYGGFQRIVRGFDPEQKGVRIDDFTATLDGGCGFGGHLVCGCLSASGEMLDLFQV